MKRVAAGKSRRASAKPAEPPAPPVEVIDLLDSSESESDDAIDDDSPICAVLVSKGAARPPRGRGVNGTGGALPLSRMVTPSPAAPSGSLPAKDPLASLLASAVVSAEPPAARNAEAAVPARGRARAKPAAARGPSGRAKRKPAPTPVDADLDGAESDDDFAPGPSKKAPAAPTAAAPAPAAAAASARAEPLQSEVWSIKHEPRCPEDLIVHKKKVEEVREWLAAQVAAAGRSTGRKVAVVTGPPGCGKTTTVRVLAESLGFAVSEWHPAAEATFDEIKYLDGGDGRGEWGGGYVSKLAAFEAFAARAKMPTLTLTAAAAADAPPASSQQPSMNGNETQNNVSSTAAASRPPLVLIDDLPFAFDSAARGRLAAAVGDLARCARFPVVLFSTEASGRGQQDRRDRAAPGGLPREVASALDAAGAAAIAFNPVTALNTAKALRAVLQTERRALPEPQITAIADQAGGDLRNALNSLQFACTGIKPSLKDVSTRPAAKRQRGAKKTAAAKASGVDGSNASADADKVAYMLRDTSLSLFHGLGKLLYNKRLPVDPVPPPGAPQAWAARAPFDGFDPESVVAAAGLEAPSVAAFLHENIPNFVDDAAIFDLAACAAALSSADVLATGGRRRRTGALAADDDFGGGSTLSDVAAANVAARGVCFWNAHPAPRSWQPLRAPALFVAARGTAANSSALHEAAGMGRAVHGGAGCLDSASVVAAEVLPAVRALVAARGGRPVSPSLVLQQPATWQRFWGGKLYETVTHGGVGRGEKEVEVSGRSGGGGGSGGVRGAAGTQSGATVIEDVDPIEDPGD